MKSKRYKNSRKLKLPEKKDERKPAGKRQPLPALKFLCTMGGVLRWSLVCAFLWLLVSQIQTGIDARKVADELNSELEQEVKLRETIRSEIDDLSNPEARLSEWKSNVMRHEAGERYIRFEQSE